MIKALRHSALAILAVSLLSACPSNLPPREPVLIELQLYFTQAHDQVDAAWSGEMVSTEFAGLMGDADDTAAADLSAPVDVESGDLVRFDPVPNLHPGRWNIEIEIEWDGAQAITINCRNVAVGDPAAQLGATYVVRWIEGGTGDCISAAGMADPEVPVRDAAVLSLTAPATAVIGATVAVSVGIANNGDINENIEVTLSRQAPGAPAPVDISTLDADVNRESQGQVDFNWNTACVGPAGNYSLSARARVPDDANAANNSAPGSINLTADREIRVMNPVGPSTVSRATLGGTQFNVTIANGNSQAENNIGVTVSDSSAVEPAGTIQWLGNSAPPVNLACGQSREHYFVYFPPSLGAGGAHTLTFTLIPAAPIPGDDPSNNSVSIPITVTP